MAQKSSHRADCTCKKRSFVSDAEISEDKPIFVASSPAVVLCVAFGSALDRAIDLQKGQSPSSRRRNRQADRYAYLEEVRKAGFDPNEPRDWHGRWTVGDGQKPGFQTAQVTIPLEGPWDLPFRVPKAPTMPAPPTEVSPAPLIGPDVIPRDGIPKNPYPDRPECKKEWADAIEYCTQPMTENKINRIGKPGFKEVAPSLMQCVLGQVSEACGGRPTGPLA